MLPSEALDPAEEATDSLRRVAIRGAVTNLPERERRILELRFGFNQPVPLDRLVQDPEDGPLRRRSVVLRTTDPCRRPPHGGVGGLRLG